jgi:hypothetical protein
MTNKSLFGQGYPNPDLVLYDAKLRYEEQRDFTNEGKVGKIDNVEQSFVVKEHSNVLEKLNETKKLYANIDSLLKTGSYVEFEGSTYIVLSEVRNNGAYLETLIQFCNLDIKWKDTNGTDRSFKATNKILSESKNGEKERYYLPTINSDTRIFIQQNEHTYKIEEGMRFMIGRNVYSVGLVQDKFIDGVLYIYMKYEERNKDKDNISTGMADNSLPDFSL